MSVENALVHLLESDEQLHELISSRIYAGEADENAPMPHVVYSIDGEQREVQGNLVNASIELEAFADDYSVANQVAERIRILLHTKQTEHAGTAVRGGFLVNRSKSVLPPQDGRGRGTHVVSSDFDVWFLE